MSALYPQMLLAASRDENFDRVLVAANEVVVVFLEGDRPLYREKAYTITDASRVVSYCRWHRIAHSVTGA